VSLTWRHCRTCSRWVMVTDGTKKLVVDRCVVGDPWLDMCSGADTPTMEVTGAKHFVSHRRGGD